MPRRVALAGAALAALVFGIDAAPRLFADGLPAAKDFAAFWTAGTIALEGGNVYDGTAVRGVQRGLGLDESAIMMWNPPWAIGFVMPLGLFSFRTAYGLWVLANLGLVIASTELIWRGLGGSPARRGLAYLLVLGFAPTLLLLFTGQLTAIVMFGLAGFLFLRGRYPYGAGAVGALTALKPHMLVLFALWLVFDALRSRDGRKVLIGGAGALLFMSLPAAVADPRVWSHYAAVTTGGSSADHEHVSAWAPPLLGWWIRSAVPGRPFWVQWIPLLVGVIGFAVWGLRTRADASVPVLVALSMMIAPYGVWHHDLLLMTLPILAATVQLAERPNRTAITVAVLGYTVCDLVLFVMIVVKSPYEWFVWVVPVVLLGCTATVRAGARAGGRLSPTVGGSAVRVV